MHAQERMEELQLQETADLLAGRSWRRGYTTYIAYCIEEHTVVCQYVDRCVSAGLPHGPIHVNPFLQGISSSSCWELYYLGVYGLKSWYYGGT